MQLSAKNRLAHPLCELAHLLRKIPDPPLVWAQKSLRAKLTQPPVNMMLMLSLDNQAQLSSFHFAYCYVYLHWLHNTVADPAFPRGGGANSPGGPNDFAKISQKLHEIERIWTPRGGARPKFYYVDPPLLNIVSLPKRSSFHRTAERLTG